MQYEMEHDIFMAEMYGDDAVLKNKTTSHKDEELDRQAKREVRNAQTGRQTDRQTDRQTCRHADQHTNKNKCRATNKKNMSSFHSFVLGFLTSSHRQSFLPLKFKCKVQANKSPSSKFTSETQYA